MSFSSADGTVQGTIDGSNAIFIIGVALKRASIYRNQGRMALNIDVSFGGQFIQFYGLQIPQPGDVIVVEGWPAP
jgi:hypothetical protein